MSKRKEGKIVGRLGARYGRTVRNRVAAIEESMKRKHTCPSCGHRSVKRVSVGLWRCDKCSFTFSGAAYSPTSKVGDAARRSIRKETVV
ncbi:MAG: large subunit ribosomal protein L37Ae [Thermoproteota archaeon]|nr:large subunit ribosomal protein L37Ae [Thermoproteota archaeon]